LPDAALRGTPIKRKLEAEGRLLGTQFEPDYKFLDPKLDLFYEWMVNTFTKGTSRIRDSVTYYGFAVRSALEITRPEPGLRWQKHIFIT